MRTLTTDELIDWLPIIEARATNAWAKRFARSCMKQAVKRAGWLPSPKQARLLRMFVRQLQEVEADGFDVIDYDDCHEHIDFGGEYEHTGSAGHIDFASV